MEKKLTIKDFISKSIDETAVEKRNQGVNLMVCTSRKLKSFIKIFYFDI